MYIILLVTLELIVIGHSILAGWWDLDF